MKKIVLAAALLGAVVTQAAEVSNTLLAKATPCVACHGQQGISVNPLWPNLAGQHAAYLKKQLHDYKEGTKRSSAMMAALVAGLTETDMAELASFYSQQPLPEGKTPEKYVSLGERLYRGGDFDKHISACIACHGPTGAGNGQAGFPVLSGQQAPYTVQQLQDFKDKKRSNDLNSIMRDISARMSKDEMEAVAYYVQGLH